MARKNVEKPERTSSRNFLKTPSLISLKYLQHDRCSVKLIWACINLFLIGATALLTHELWVNLTANPTVTSLESTDYPITEVPFPAISICNLNKISKKKVEDLARFISNTSGYPLDVINDHMKTLGSMYDLNATDAHRLIEFQIILEMFSSVDAFQITNLMKSLTPSCEDFLVSCSWKNQQVNCSEIFEMRLTYEGYCCLFNYVKVTAEMEDDNFLDREVKFGYPGLYFGLTVEMNHQLNDYFFTKESSLGANVHVFNPADYPDKNSGSLNEFLVGASTEFLMQLEAINFHSVLDVIDYSVEKRECYFPFERETSFGHYSESDCLMDCRIESMIDLCGCVPFMIPQNKSSVCGFSNIQCLNHYTIKWQSLAPPNAFTDKYFLREAHNALHCDYRCYPACESYLFQILTNPVPIKNPAFGNNSVLRVFYSDAHSSLYKQDVYYYWFEILSKIGGVCGFILGVSLVSLVEIITLCAYKVHNYFHHNNLFNENFCIFCVWSF